MANATKTAEELIAERYQKLIDAQKAKLGADYDISKREYESQLGSAEGTYQPLRNEAYVNMALAERARKEDMANMGMSGGGGTSLSLQQRNATSLLSTLGDVSRQQQGFEDKLGLALANLKTTHDADLGSAIAELEAQRIAAQLSQKQFDDNYAQSENRLAISQKQFDDNYAQSENRLAISQKDDLYARYYQLYKSRMITKKQFEEATGIDLK